MENGKWKVENFAKRNLMVIESKEFTQSCGSTSIFHFPLSIFHFFIIFHFFLIASSVMAMDCVTVKTESGTQTLQGEIIVNAKDGGIVLRDAMNQMHPVTPEQMLKKTSDSRPFEFYTSTQIKEKMLEQLPKGFKVHQTEHYLVFYDTSEAFAQWAGTMFERLHDAFYHFWTSNGLEMKTPDTPLVALIFSDSKVYAEFCHEELGEAGASIIGFYSMQSNRINLYDLTGRDEFNQGTTRKTTDAARIRNILAQPEASRLVATIIHEATHQLAYNSGMQVRYADMPRWLSEGIAMYFETPNMKSSTGMGALGKDNLPRLRRIKQRLNTRNPEAIKMMITDDSLFTNLQTAEDAYAEAWGLTWVLIKSQPKKFVEYLRTMGTKQPFVWDSKDERLEEFENCFGPWTKINQTFIRTMKSKRGR